MVDTARLLPASFRSAGRRTLNRLGIEVSRRPYVYQLVERLRAQGITTVVDIGANEGQYATKLLEARYRDRLVSVEPLRTPYEKLRTLAAGQSNWEVVHSAVGAETGTLTVNIAGNSQSSSVLPMLDLHATAAPASRYVGSEIVPAITLHDLFASRGIDPAACFVKIDVQGYESSVLDGAKGLLPDLAMVELELSLVPLYDGQALMPELVARMREHRLELWSLRPAFADSRDGRLLQVDGVFARFDSHRQPSG